MDMSGLAAVQYAFYIEDKKSEGGTGKSRPTLSEGNDNKAHDTEKRECYI